MKIKSIHEREGEAIMTGRKQNMLEGPLFGNIVAYTIPIILTGILQLLFNAADLMVVGRFCGSISVAAVGATTSLTNLLVNFFVGLSAGAGVATAHAIGGGQDQQVHQTVHTTLPASLICGTLVTVIGVGFSGTFLKWMGTPENVLELSALYMKIYFAGITFTMIYNFSAAILRAAGDTRSPLIFLSISGVINVVLNVIFVTVFRMNVAGVALATTISQGIAAALVVRSLIKRQDACRLEWRKLRFYAGPLKKILRIGLPAGIQSSLFGISNVLIQSSVNSFGDVFIAGNAAATNLEGFLYLGLNSFHQTAVNFCGQNAGAGRYDRVGKTMAICLGCTGVLGLVLGTLGWMNGPNLLSMYITDSPEAISYGMIRLSYVCRLYFLCGLMDVCTGGLRGMGASFLPMLISVLGVCVFRVLWVTTIFQIPQFHTPRSLYISYPISWTITFVIQMIAFVILFRRRMKKE